MIIFGRYFKLTLIIISALEIISLLVFSTPVLNSILWGLIVFTVLVLSLYRLEYGIYAMFAELAIGSYGYLFAYDSLGLNLSLRMGIFLVILGVFTWNVLRDWQVFKEKMLRFRYLYYYLGFFAILGWGVLNGFLSGNSFANVFFDSNGYLFFAMIFPLIYVMDRWERWSRLFQVLLGAVTISSIKALVLFYIFTHDRTVIAPYVYQWVRDTRVGEITQMNGNFFRIFFQSQIYTLMVLFVLAVLILARYLLAIPNERRTAIVRFILAVMCLSSVFLSLSRSFWAGGLLALAAFMGLFLFFYPHRRLFLAKFILLAIFLTGSSFLLIQAVIRLPSFNWGWLPQISLEALQSRVQWLPQEAAVASRWNQIPPLMGKILERPLLGNGFGAEVTYQSSDPRVIAASPGRSGVYTTFAFEWGYLDMLLKFGAAGLLILLILLGVLFWDGLRLARITLQQGQLSEEGLLGIGFFLGYLALLGTHIFSPYLNHPLGIGYLVLFSSYLFSKYSLDMGVIPAKAGIPSPVAMYNGIPDRAPITSGLVGNDTNTPSESLHMD